MDGGVCVFKFPWKHIDILFGASYMILILKNSFLFLKNKCFYMYNSVKLK